MASSFGLILIRAFSENAVVAAAHEATLKNPTERRRLARERLLRLARLMDAAIEVPFLRTTVGMDAARGLVPVVGDLVSPAIGRYAGALARELGASGWLQTRMIGNLLADAAIGAMPLAGDIADLYFRAHLRNLKLLQKELGEPFFDVTTRPGLERPAYCSLRRASASSSDVSVVALAKPPT